MPETQELVRRELDIDLVIVSRREVDAKWHGTWIQDQPLTHKQSKRIIEMIAGRQWVYSRSEAKPLKLATPEQWGHVIGLVVLGAAERVQL